MKKENLISIVLTLFMCIKTQASTTFASLYGYNTNNATAAFQAAILSPNDTIIVDLQVSDWNVGPSSFANLSNKTIIFQPNVTLRALPNLFNNTQACLLKFRNCTNISLIGYGATLKMNKREYALLDDSEYRMSISFEGSSNITIKGFIIDESGGDGIYIGGDGLQYSENIFIEDVQCINHYRQGMSITNVQNMTVKNSYFQNTQGTLPEAGIDVEPYQTNQRIVNLNIEKCYFENNGWSGIALALLYLDSTSIPVSIYVKDCVFKNNNLPTNAYEDCEIFISANKTAPVQGNVLFERCFIEESQYGAFYTRKTADAFHVTFKDCVFQNVSQLPIQYNEPIFLEVPDYSNPSSYLGGLHFDNVFVSYTNNFSFFRVFGWPTLAGIKDITGSFTVVEPNNNSVLYSNVPDTINCNYWVKNQTSLPNTTLTIEVETSDAIECNNQAATFMIARSSSNITYPMGVSYTTTGTANVGNDVLLPPKGIIIPANGTERLDSVFARQDNLTEQIETLNFQFNTSNLYVILGNNVANINIRDCNPSNTNRYYESSWIVYPNPTSESIIIDNPETNALKVSISNILGVGLLDYATYQNEKIELSHLPNGIYFVNIYDSNSGNSKTVKLVKN